MHDGSARIQVLLDLDPHRGQVTGTAHAADTEEREFSGYLELVSVIEEIRTAGDASQLSRTVSGGAGSA